MMKNIDWVGKPGNVDAMRALLSEIETMNWLDNHGDVPKGVKMFDTEAEAINAAKSATSISNWDFTRCAAYDAMMEQVYAANRCAAENEITSWIWTLARTTSARFCKYGSYTGARDACALSLAYLCDDLDIDRHHIDFTKLRWHVWGQGFGVAFDVCGIPYCYRKL